MHAHSYPAIFLFFLLTLAGCHKTHSKQLPASKPIDAKILILKTAHFAKTATLPGLVIAQDHITLFSKSGGKVLKVTIHSGEYVSQNTILLQMDPAMANSAYAHAQAQSVAASALAANARHDYKRYRILFKQGVATRKELEHITRRYQTAQAAAIAAQSAVKTAQAEFSYVDIRSPISGFITEKQVTSGDMIQAGDALLSIDSPAIKIRTTPGNHLFNLLTPSTPTFVSTNKHQWAGTITEAVNSANPVTHTHLVEISLPDHTGLHPGTYVNVSFTTGKQEGILIPATDLLTRMGLKGVFLLGKDKKAHFHLVKTGSTFKTKIEIVAGLAPGDQLIESSLSSPLKNGQPIHVITAR
ncbi:MAG: efflux RND transporter periplasmic adaptor subunit [Proteobacteria bacterium]|nr:efflux RND transporter periplasmic adaptor subunit [Pseudomonadota bacterium]